MIDGVTRRGSSPVFVGRRRELAQLDDAYGRAVSGQPSLVLVAGDAGIGKSRLIAEFARGVESADGIVAAGGCLDLGEGGLPYAPFVEALRALARSMHREARAEAFGPASEVLATLVPDLRSGHGDDAADGSADAAGRRARLFDAVIEVLGRVSEDAPLALVLEDIHWADGSTRDLIRFLVRNIRAEHLVIVATYRSDDLHRRHPLMPLLTELDRAERVERLQLDPFDRDELREQLEAILGEPPSDRVVEGLLDRSDGLPFYVEELVADGHGEPVGIPTTLRDILGYRLSALTGDVSILVGAASVMGGRVIDDRLAAVTDLDGVRLDVALGKAVEARILVQVTSDGRPAFAFRHALLRETAYDELLPTTRIALHARLAERLDDEIRAGASDAATFADLAIHADLGLDRSRALTARIQASRALRGAAAFQEALVHAERALELWPLIEQASTAAGMRHAELVAMTGQAAADASIPRRALDLFQLALTETGPDADLASLAMLLGDTWIVAFEAFEFDVVEAVSKRMESIVDALPISSLKARVLGAIGSRHWIQGRHWQAIEVYERSMAIAEEVGDEAEWVVAASSASHALTDLVRGQRAIALLDRVASMSPGYDGSVIPFWALADRGEAMWGVGRFDDAVRTAAEGIEAARRYGVDDRIAPWITTTDALFDLGRLDEAEASSHRVNSSAYNDHPMLLALTTIAKCHIVRGEIDAARAILAARPTTVVGRSDDPSGIEPGPPNAWDFEADLLLARAASDFDGARSAVESVRRRAPDNASDLLLTMMLGPGVGAAADEAVHLRARRRQADAERVATIGQDWFDAIVEIDRSARVDGGAGPFVDAIVAMATAEHSRLAGTSDPARWAEAVERWDRIGHRYQGAYSRLRSAEAVLDAGGARSDAARSLDQARATARSMGAAPLLADIEAVATRARMDLSAADAPSDASIASSEPGVLTPRERDVLRLVATGHTNREIGDRLFISEKTASVHVSNAMAKLGALSRYEAAAAAEREGLL